MKRFKNYLLIPALLQSGLCFAHIQSGTLSVSSSATDLYQITCLDDGSGTPALLQAQVLSGLLVANPPTTATVTQLSLQIYKGAIASNSSDSISNDANYSPLISLSGGAGQYYVMVDKNQATTNAKVYTLQYHCLTSNGTHTGTELTTLQNQ